MSMADELWALVPAVYKRRDEDAGKVLRALIEVLAEQVDILHDDIAGLYDNWFIETCEDWVVPYIGDLTDALPMRPTAPPSASAAAGLAQVAPPRRLVANAIRFRRRKGTFSMVSQLARDVAGWPAQAVEFGRLLTINQDVRDPSSPLHGLIANLRDPAALIALETEDDPLARSLDVRAASAPRSPGRYGPGNVGLFLFTSLIELIAQGEAFCVEEEGAANFCFDPLGRDLALYRPATTPDDVPGPIGRGELLANYGPDAAVMIWVQANDDGDFAAVPRDQVRPANLDSWRDRPTQGTVAIDPQLGRILFTQRAVPKRVLVRYSHAAPGPIGGGTYRRKRTTSLVRPILVAAGAPEGHDSLKAALQSLKPEMTDVVIEFRDSLTYDEDRLLIEFKGAPRRLVIRAAPGTRPVIRLADYEAGAADAWRIHGDGASGSSLTLEGLTIAGRGLAVSDFGGSLTLLDCTLLPGWMPSRGAGHRHTEGPSLSFRNCTGPAALSACVVGPIFVQADEHIDEPLPLSLTNSIVDAGPSGKALLSPGAVPFVTMTVSRSTIFGHVAVHALPLAENSIFADRLVVARRSDGCVRFCAIPAGSRVPRRFGCVPRDGEPPGLAPVFLSRRYGTPEYAVLAESCPIEIAQGADDRGEMGAYHDLFRPQREANLLAAIDEYLPADVSVGIIYLR